MSEVVEITYRRLLPGGSWQPERRVLVVEPDEPEQDDEPDETPAR